MASDLTEAQILEIRRNYLRDEWNASSPLPGGMSQMNRALGKNYFTNDQIKAIDESVVRRWDWKLDEIEDQMVSERLEDGDDQATAEAAGAAERLDARYHLIAAVGIGRMADDPGYSAAQTVKGADVQGNRTAMKRQSMEHFAYAGLGSVELER